MVEFAYQSYLRHFDVKSMHFQLPKTQNKRNADMPLTQLLKSVTVAPVYCWGLTIERHDRDSYVTKVTTEHILSNALLIYE